VSVEIDEQPAPVQVGLHLVGGHDCASVHEKKDLVSYDIRVCRDESGTRGSNKEATLSLDFERVVSSEKGSEARKFRVKSRITLGKKVVVGKWVQGDQAMSISVEAR